MLRVRNRWWIVAACVCGLVCSGGPVNIWTFGVFLKPVAEALHIARSDLGGALAVAGAFSAVLAPVTGWLLDRFGGRLVLLIGIVLFAAATAMQSLMTAAPLVIYSLFILRSLGSAGPTASNYAFVVARWFDRRRGLALGIALSGVGLGTAIIPQIAAFLIGHLDWQSAYIGVGGVILVLAGIPVLLLVRDPDASDRARMPHLAEADLAGVNLREALTGTWRFWGLAVAFCVGIIVLNGTLTQIVAMLTDRGVSLQAATTVLSATGIAAVGGRLLSGWLVDRFHGPYVAIGFFTLLLIGVPLFGSGLPEPAPIIGAMLCGVANGSEVDLMGFFVSRYFGLKYYGRILGTLFGFFQASLGIGPFIATKSFDLYHSYGPAFQLFEVMTVVPIVIFVFLGPYPFPAKHRPAPSARAEKTAA
jgi:MFS family permease